MNNRSAIQQIFASYVDCEFLNGEAVKDDDGTELQSVAWLHENRVDDFLEELSYALLQAGVGRDALMRVFLRHALRVTLENPHSLHVGDEERKNIRLIVEEGLKYELFTHHQENEALRAKVIETLPTAFLVKSD
jgi:hypothetical protein